MGGIFSFIGKRVSDQRLLKNSMWARKKDWFVGFVDEIILTSAIIVI